MIVHLKWLRVRCAINSGIIIFVYCKAGMTAVIPALLFHEDKLLLVQWVFVWGRFVWLL